MGPRTKDARDIIDKLHPRRPHIILHTGTLPLTPLVLSSSKNTNTVTFSFTMATADVMLPRTDARSLRHSLAADFGVRDYGDPAVVNQEFTHVHSRLDQLEENLQKSVGGLKTDVDNMRKDVNDLKTDVEGLKTEVRTGFATLEAMIKNLVAHNTQPAGTAPPSIQGVPSSLSDERGSADGLPPSSVVPDAGHVSPTPSVPHSSSSVQGGSSSVQRGLPSLQGSSPTSSVEGFYSSSPVQFARTYADSSEEAGPSVTQAQAMSDLPAIALHAAEVLDTVQRETESSIGKLKKLTSMISFKNLRK
ncbi:hypothetical protein C8Q74DRAFT_1452855 [Fomes fomentarius]|nr:hypothetical protein C8Q74DRAFT_1452855 [Fomes fomentarius]